MMPSSMLYLIFATMLATGYGLNCYVCNSDEYPACGNPFQEDDAMVGGLLKNCNARDVPHAVYKDPSGRDIVARFTFCTKTTQQEAHHGSEHEVVIRGCGFRNDTRLMPEEGEDHHALKCIESESPNGNLMYCACYGDGGCNPGARVESGVLVAAIATFLGIAMILQ